MTSSGGAGAERRRESHHDRRCTRAERLAAFVRTTDGEKRSVFYVGRCLRRFRGTFTQLD